jgi:hypothetical protein
VFHAAFAIPDRLAGVLAVDPLGAGHFVWHEAPGCLVAAMDRLVADPSEAESSLIRGR